MLVTTQLDDFSGRHTDVWSFAVSGGQKQRIAIGEDVARFLTWEL